MEFSSKSGGEQVGDWLLGGKYLGRNVDSSVECGGLVEHGWLGGESSRCGVARLMDCSCLEWRAAGGVIM